jgi:hypothetical protein
MPPMLIKALFFSGVAFSAYLLGKYTNRGLHSVIHYFKAMFNASKYLYAHTHNHDPDNPRYYAVILGCANRAGGAFAHYLARQGFNLILIERDMTPITDLEISLSRLSTAPAIVKIELKTFDDETVKKALNSVKDLPVKVFVNCKNARRGKSKKRVDPAEANVAS